MKSILIAAVSFILCADFCYAQTVNSYQVKEIDQPLTDPRAIPGCRVLWKEERALQKYVQQHPEVLAAAKTAQPTAWNFHVNDTKAWWATNLATNTEYQVPSTCRKVGVHAYYFVADSLWNNDIVNQTQVDSIAAAFDFRTPASPTKGIYQTDVETFGNPPDVDQDSLIIILILDIKDSFGGSGTYIAGYFFSVNEFLDGSPAIGSHRSNHAEIYYVDGVQAKLSTANGLATAIETAAHEFQHMIHWNYDKSEITFINEGCSMIAEVVCGFPVSFQSSYASNTNVYLLQWNNSNTIPDYARAQRWLLYLWNQFPSDYLKLLVQNTGTGITGIDGALAQYGTQRRFADVFTDWLVANELNDASVDLRYAYTYSGALPSPVGKKYVDPNTGSQSGNVVHLGADYITFAGGSNLSITFSSGSTAIVIKAIEVGASAKNVVDVTGGSFSEPAFGTTYSSITFVVINTSQSVDVDYSYQASGIAPGVVELKHDVSEPAGLLQLSTSDTACVVFDGVPGAKLDSIRVALRRAGSITGGIWRHTGAAPRPTPLGTRLAVPITASISTTPPTPYPVPWPNWSTIDLRSYNIDASGGFVAGFVFGADALTPGIMVTKYPGTDSYHSFTYLHNPSSGSANWYYLSTGDSIWLYLIRAYIHTAVTEAADASELLPASFTLLQNFPNPFNPTTRIEYELPSSQHVLLVVYDILGRETRTLVDEVEPAGSYRTIWDGKDDAGRQVASGVYLYQLRTASFIQTNKMVLLK